MSEWLVLTLGMLAACAVVIVVVLLRQRRHGAEVDPSETPDVIEYMTMMIGKTAGSGRNTQIGAPSFSNYV
ncbi:hypothetical protein OHB04_02175 [Streptomyces sp. NBC_01775]|nr:hypothetical protein [Streptomyces sp. NBC_01775]WSB81950.1 hypothetical protein OHB04_02175 [Streptomyces sp. NBC_01775]